MNAHARLNLDRPFWTVLCDGKMHTFSRREDVELHTASTFGVPFSVVEWNAAENSAHDVTPDFQPDDETDEPDGDYCHSPVLTPVASAWRK